MATVPPLATTADLSSRNIITPDGVDAAKILAAASAAVRDAAGCPISEVTSTITLVVDEPTCQIDLPAGPVTDVTSVAVDGAPLTGWRKMGDALLMPAGWTRTLPVEITVDYTHGLITVPADLVDMVCAMAAMAFKDAAGGSYGSDPIRSRIQLGDYAESFTRPVGLESPSRMTIPKSVREQLRARFGSSAVTVRVTR